MTAATIIIIIMPTYDKKIEQFRILYEVNGASDDEHYDSDYY